MQLFKNKWTPLFLSNFLGVYNDNFLKNCIIFITVGWSLPTWLTQSQLISIVSASLVIPYLLLSPFGGRLAVIYSKLAVFRFFKFLELPIMLIACVAFYYQWVLLAIFSVLLMGIQSCLYSPSKYSLIRDIGGENEVSYGSGIFEMMAFLGILIGTVTASVVSDTNQKWLIYFIFMALAALGYWVTKNIKAEESAQNKENKEALNPVTFVLNSYHFAKNYKQLNLAIFGASAFWLIGGMLQMNLIIHTKSAYQSSNTTTGLVMSIAAIGIAIGCWAAGRISGNQVKKGLILIGLFGMSLLLAVLTFIKLSFPLYVLAVFAVAFMGGLFQIPCLSMLQKSNLGRKLGNMIAYLNLVTFIFVLIGTALFSVTTFYTSENSYAVFGSILSICIIVSLIFILESTEFWNETKKILHLK